MGAGPDLTERARVEPGRGFRLACVSSARVTDRARGGAGLSD